MQNRSKGRFAVYYAPEEEASLHEFGRNWLGRDAITGQAIEASPVSGLSAERRHEITESPRHYGFHGTLKPPFHLADGFDPDQLYASVRSLASEVEPFSLGLLELRWLGNFLALAPSQPNRQVSRLASECVSRLDSFRAPPSREELARRRASGLTPNQERLLRQWGYPYVMEELRFHLSLTGPMRDPAEKERVFSAADILAFPLRSAPIDVTSLCIFEQEDRKAPFYLTRRFAFSGA